MDSVAASDEHAVVSGEISNEVSSAQSGITIAARTQAHVAEKLGEIFRARDRVFGVLMGVQWLFAIVLAVAFTPYTWAGQTRTLHIHVYYAVLSGVVLYWPVQWLVRNRPGTSLTRHTVAAAQIMWSGLFIHLTGGRIETHFHVFGSLALLAFYPTAGPIFIATAVVALDHIIRGYFWPQSIYGLSSPQWWRFIEHVFWVAFEDAGLFVGIRQSRAHLLAVAHRQAQLEHINGKIWSRVTERTRQLEKSRESYRQLLESTHAVAWQMDLQASTLGYVGPQIRHLIGFTASDCICDGLLIRRIHPEDWPRFVSLLREQTSELNQCEIECRIQHMDGHWVHVCNMVSLDRKAGRVILRGVMTDISERKRLEDELYHAQKLEAVGRLASGIAHEINTPIQFVGDSATYLREGYGDLIALVDQYHRLVFGPATSLPARDRESLARAEQAADLEYQRANVPQAFEAMLEGARRVSEIVRSMKAFAHPDARHKEPADITEGIRHTMTISNNEWKYVADIETDFGDLPLVPCHLGELNQVILNLIVNAAHAIGDVVKGTDAKGLIRIRTRVEDGSAVISLSDTGSGIPEAVQSKIFDPFFTTKEVGRGTGQGLSISRSVVVEKHGGTLTFETEAGVGTTFYIRLPLADRAAA